MNNRKLEKMDDFFAARIDEYEAHMLGFCGDAYRRFAELVPRSTAKILDLGCGTGLELDEIFKRIPNMSVVGIDVTQAMLDRLKQKHSDRTMELICGSYFDFDFGANAFDTAISFQTMHHFSHHEKVGLYKRVRKALRPNGVYVECDCMVTEQSVEDKLFAENARLRSEMNIPLGEFYHFDTPCTVENQVAMLEEAGFMSADVAFRLENTTIIVAKK